MKFKRSLTGLKYDNTHCKKEKAHKHHEDLAAKVKTDEKEKQRPALEMTLPKQEFTMINRKYHDDAMFKPYKKDMDKLAHAMVLILKRRNK